MKEGEVAPQHPEVGHGLFVGSLSLQPRAQQFHASEPNTIRSLPAFTAVSLETVAASLPRPDRLRGDAIRKLATGEREDDAASRDRIREAYSIRDDHGTDTDELGRGIGGHEAAQDGDEALAVGKMQV